MADFKTFAVFEHKRETREWKQIEAPPFEYAWEGHYIIARFRPWSTATYTVQKVGYLQPLPLATRK